LLSNILKLKILNLLTDFGLGAFCRKPGASGTALANVGLGVERGVYCHFFYMWRHIALASWPLE
jgi:hypothetical protein